uniref:Titin n=1 Tax=Pundamilia nyererei TaxID=303518 RepID=A0A3B4GCT5_9CICH
QPHSPGAYSTVCASCHKSSWKVGDLEEGKMYFFRILAENEYGIGLPVETLEPIKASERPLPPGKVSLREVTSKSVTLSWEKPDHDGGSRITGYIVEMQGKGSEKWTQVMVVKSNEAHVTGLTQGEEYTFRISSINEKGVSDPRPLNVPVVAKDLVISPTFKLLFSTFSVLAGDDLKIDVPYAAHPKATATWLKDGVALKETTRVNADATDKNLLLVIKEACRDDVGTYTVKLTNTAGEASTDISVIVLDKPGPPTGPIKLDEVTADSVILSWDPPQYDGGCAINNYIVEKRDTSTTNWQIVSATVARTTIKAARLIENQTYEFRVIAKNAAGVFSQPSDSTGAITAKDEVDPPKIDLEVKYSQTVVVNAGETFKLEAAVYGKPVPTIHWLKEGQEITEAARLELKNTDFTACLVVKEAIRVDGGQYILLVKNVGGEKSVNINVKPIIAKNAFGKQIE